MFFDPISSFAAGLPVTIEWSSFRHAADSLSLFSFLQDSIITFQVLLQVQLQLRPEWTQE